MPGESLLLCTLYRFDSSLLATQVMANPCVYTKRENTPRFGDPSRGSALGVSYNQPLRAPPRVRTTMFEPVQGHGRVKQTRALSADHVKSLTQKYGRKKSEHTQT